MKHYVKKMYVIIWFAVLAMPISYSYAYASDGGFTRIDGQISGADYSLFKPDD